MVITVLQRFTSSLKTSFLCYIIFYVSLSPFLADSGAHVIIWPRWPLLCAQCGQVALSPFPVSCANSGPHTESRFSHCYLIQWEWGSSPLFHLEQICFYVYRRPFQVSFSLHRRFLSQQPWIPSEFWGGHKLKLPAEGSTGLSLSLALRSGSQCTFPSFSGKNDPGGNLVCLQPGASTRTQGLPIQPVTYCSDRREQGGRRDAGGPREPRKGCRGSVGVSQALPSHEPALACDCCCLLSCPLTPETLVPNSIEKP